MKAFGIIRWNGLFFLAILASLFLLEFYGKIFERGLGHYLKWQNSERPQLGRIWERDRQAVVAQNKIRSIRSSLDSREESTLAIGSLKQLFEQVEPSFPLVVSRKKFLQLYYDFPGQWSRRVVSPYELIRIDAEKTWDRVLLNRYSTWISVGFIDRQNIPVHEIFLSFEILDEVQSTRTTRRGKLEESGFSPDRIFPISQFLPVLRTLDPKTRKAVFPDPQWFLEKDYHITRVGATETTASDRLPSDILFGIEYDTDYYTSVLLIPVPLETANNMLSQIEKSDLETMSEGVPALTESSGEIH
ncbi:MAG: hypothetical protein V3U37_03940 [Nitrospinaceae bacterium]